ncbi:hypothetical protein MC885_005877 [Smutsia gigantea]|nr:hypothetical protein MC885_005877 [Smutsia gigantea]
MRKRVGGEALRSDPAAARSASAGSGVARWRAQNARRPGAAGPRVARPSAVPRAAPVSDPGRKRCASLAAISIPEYSHQHARSTRGAAAGARRPRVKKKVRPRVARSEEAARSGEAASSEEVATRGEAALSGEMAATWLSVTVTHSNEKHDLHVTPQQGGSEPIVQDLAQVVEEATGVPLPFQKLIFKGFSLGSPYDQPQSSPEEEVKLKKLKDLEKSVEKIANQLKELNKELTGIQQGFLAKDLQAEALCKLNRRVKATIEQFMKILEEIDTLILPENFKDSRLKRKGLVKRVQAFLAECDIVEQNICQETERLQSTNLALAK